MATGAAGGRPTRRSGCANVCAANDLRGDLSSPSKPGGSPVERPISAAPNGQHRRPTYGRLPEGGTQLARPTGRSRPSPRSRLCTNAASSFRKHYVYRERIRVRNSVGRFIGSSRDQTRAKLNARRRVIAGPGPRRDARDGLQAGQVRQVQDLEHESDGACESVGSAAFSA
jgi:hypothetical protein